MALANKGTTPTPTPSPFEAEDDTDQTQAAASTPAKPTPPAPQPAATAPAPAANTESPAPAPAPVAVRQKAAVAVATPAAARPRSLLQNLENAAPDLAGVQVGAFPRITVGLDGYSVNKTEKNLGGWIEFDMISWNYLTIVTPGVAQPTAEDNKRMRTSVDHEWLQDGSMTVNDYIAELKQVHNYDRAQSKKYIELYGAVTASEKGGAVAEEDMQLHQLSLSPQSVTKWQGFLATLMWKTSKGTNTDKVKVRLSYNSKVIGTNKFAVAEFKLVD